MGSLKETGKGSQPAEKNERFSADCMAGAAVSGRLKLSWLQRQFYVQGELLCTEKKVFKVTWIWN